MRPRRALRLVLPAALGFLFFFVRLLKTNDIPLDTALDDIIRLYLPDHPATATQNSLESPRSPRDFKIPEKYIPYVADACILLRTKRILLVGPETTYYLHSLWLSALRVHEHRTHECHGPDLCNFHHICLPRGYSTPQIRFKVPPKDAELVSSGSVLLRYVLSTSLFVSKDKNDHSYTRPVIDPLTGVRLKNMYWLHHAQKADVILMNRGPIPAPAWTYAGDEKFGNWSFTADLPRHLGPGSSLALQIVNAAFHVTKTRFIPEVLASLSAIRRDTAIKRKKLAWHSSWYYGFAADSFHPTDTMDDPWALYYNSQVYMQNYLLNALLPHHGVHFLPRMSPVRILPDNSSIESGPQDRLRFPLQSPNALAMEAEFLKSLIELLQRN